MNTFYYYLKNRTSMHLEEEQDDDEEEMLKWFCCFFFRLPFSQAMADLGQAAFLDFQRNVLRGRWYNLRRTHWGYKTPYLTQGICVRRRAGTSTLMCMRHRCLSALHADWFVPRRLTPPPRTFLFKFCVAQTTNDTRVTNIRGLFKVSILNILIE